MKAAVVRAFGQPLVIEEVPVPRPGAGDVLVKIEACGVCHTDLHAAEGDWPVKPNPPFIPGHEGVGHVVAVGAGVDHVKEGDRVGIPWLYSACGYCEHCLGGWETLCESQQNTGYSVNGGFAQYALANAGYGGHLPAQIGVIEIAPGMVKTEEFSLRRLGTEEAAAQVYAGVDEPLLAEDIADVSPGHTLPIQLYWHCWNLESEVLEALTQALIEASARDLDQGNSGR